MTLSRSIYVYFSRLFGAGLSLLNAIRSVFPFILGKGVNSKRVTEKYPDPVSSKTEEDLPPRSRGLLVNDIEKCTGCGDCQSLCPVSCIEIESESGDEIPKTWVSVFKIDFGKCVFCGLCVEACPPSSLFHSKKMEMSSQATPDLVVEFGKGRISDKLREKWKENQKTDDWY